MARHPPCATGATPNPRQRAGAGSAALSERRARRDRQTAPLPDGPSGGGGHSPAPGAGLTALLASRGAALAAVRAQEVAGQLQILEVGKGDKGAGHAPVAGRATAAQPGNARPLPSGPARPCARRMRRGGRARRGGAEWGALRAPPSRARRCDRQSRVRGRVPSRRPT